MAVSPVSVSAPPRQPHRDSDPFTASVPTATAAPSRQQPHRDSSPTAIELLPPTHTPQPLTPNNAPIHLLTRDMAVSPMMIKARNVRREPTSPLLLLVLVLKKIVQSYCFLLLHDPESALVVIVWICPKLRMPAKPFRYTGQIRSGPPLNETRHQTG